MKGGVLFMDRAEKEHETYSRDLAGVEHDVIVIGSGISGLTVASLLTRLGRKVTVLEQHYVPGGATHVFRRKGYEWNTGLHYLGVAHNPAHPLRKVFDLLTDRELGWGPRSEVYDRFVFPDQTFAFPAGAEAFREYLFTHFPAEKKGIGQYLKLLMEARLSTKYYGISRVFPSLRFLLPHTPFPRLFSRSTDEVLRPLISDHRLRGLLTGQYGNYALPPKESSFGVHAVVADHYLDGSTLPMGGPGEIAVTMGRAIRKRGGRIYTRARVDEILTNTRGVTGVRMAGGEILRAKIVISTVGETMMKNHLLRGKAGTPSRKRTPSYLSLAVGVNSPLETFNYDGANLWVHPSYDHDENFRKYKTGESQTPALAYVSFPSLKDPSWEKRVGNKISVDILGLCPAEWFSRWEQTAFGKRPQDYEEKKTELAAPYMDILYRHFPEFQGKVEHMEISSPLTTKHYFQNFEGETYGLSSGPGRFLRDEPGPWSGIRGLYLSGQDTLFLGVFGALVSGILTAGSIHPVGTLSELWSTGLFES